MRSKLIIPGIFLIVSLYVLLAAFATVYIPAASEILGNADASARYTVIGTYKDGAANKTLQYTAIYDDAYFLPENSSVLQGELAKLSILAASAAYTETYAEDLLKDCGFTAKRITWKVTRKDNDCATASVGIRKVSGNTIAAIWIKGTSNNYEWVSNFHLGKGKTHSGFAIAERRLWDQICVYLEKNNALNDDTIFWITGHSRGAAVANLMAKRLTDKYTKSHVFAYTFATPRVSTLASEKTEQEYNNIFNFLNPGDFITEVAPEKWGYYRYGNDIILSSLKKPSMKRAFKKLTGIRYRGLGRIGKRLLLKTFLEYAGDSVSNYYSMRITRKSGSILPSISTAPALFCQRGLGYILAGDSLGYAYALGIASNDSKAASLLSKIVIAGSISEKFIHAHTQAGYLCWVDAMY